MAKKVTSFKTKGMNRDLSVSAFNPEFSFENMNLRLSTNEGNTMLSWVNEKGPYKVGIDYNGGINDSIIGDVIGTAVLNHHLILFVKDNGNETHPDYIYSFTVERDGVLKGKLLYQGNLNFRIEHPIETLVSYESEDIQKVYWTDNYNQPRVINIAVSDDKIKTWNSTHIRHDQGSIIDTFFDFSPAINFANSSSISVTKNPSGGGTFSPGVVQYCYTYFNKHGQQTNIVDVSSLYYLSNPDRGTSPEDKVSSSFTIRISKLDTTYDYVRLYSIQRTSIDAVPSVRHIIDLSTNNSITYIDNGTTGSSVDPTKMLYIGGRDILAYTMIDKDNTLFLGNITERNLQVPLRYSETDIIFSANKPLALDHTYGVYANTHQLKNHSQREITTFKGGEWYRFGMQLQMANGQWSDPIYLGTKQNTIYPNTYNKIKGTDYAGLVEASTYINLTSLRQYGLDISKIKRVRPLIAYPSIGDRSVICQGVINPTVFNAEDRKTNSPYAQASWFFRPYMVGKLSDAGNNTNINIDEYIKVENINGKLSTNVDSNFIGHTTPMYPLFYKRTLEETTDNTIPYYTHTQNVDSNGNPLNTDVWAQTQALDKTTVGHVQFNGLIQLNQYTQVLLRYDPWPVINRIELPLPNNNKQVIESYYDKTYFVSKSSLPVQVYSNLITLSPTNRFIYSDSAKYNSLNSYTLYIDNSTVHFSSYYKITFSAVPSGTYSISDVRGTGNGLSYHHFKPITAQSDNSKINSVEIQGSSNTYASVISQIPIKNVKSNTEFFVDQSIVTLNSPDIEFDTNVQTYATDGLKLRIVGFIPITSNASAHHITYKNSMLEKDYYNNETNSTDIRSPKDTIFGTGESHENVIYTANPISVYAGNRLVSDYLWNDTMPYTSNGITKTDKDNTYNYLIFPWQRTGSLNTDTRSADKASSYLETKKESTLLYSLSSKYLSENISKSDMNSYPHFSNIGSQMVLTENSEVMNVRLPRQCKDSSEVNYYPNIDKVLVNGNGYNIICYKDGDTKKTILGKGKSDPEATKKKVNNPILMRYKSTSHAVIDICEDKDGVIDYMPYGIYKGDTDYILSTDAAITDLNNVSTFWGDKFTMKARAEVTGDNNYTNAIPLDYLLNGNSFNYLWLGELYRDKDESTVFGGTTDDAIKSTNWVVGGEAVTVTNDNISNIQLVWDNGDTYFQRYDCLKTYPFTEEDPNQLVEILSFMCETRVNIDGRYDRNRGQLDNTNMSPINFNLFNPVYTQRDNFFTYKRALDDKESTKYKNLITYTQTKTSGADVDQYTHVTLASVLEMDGDKGPVESLQRLDNNVIAFQDKGIAQILYNENVQLSTQSGVPIEIANSGKVQGKRYISDSVGCNNKFSIANSPMGIYFMDGINKSIYFFNGKLRNLSTELGFNAWAKKNIKYTDYATDEWSPVDFKGNFVSYYDTLNQDILFINSDIALAYSEKFNIFTSFYSYGEIPYFVNFDSDGIWIKSILNFNMGSYTSSLYLHNRGGYGYFFDSYKPYWMILVGNPEPQLDKVFTNLEFRATVDGEGTGNDKSFTPYLPFTSLETWNEYQHGIMSLENKTGHSAMVHHPFKKTATASEALKRKFRIWRCDIPRDNAELSSDSNISGLSRFDKHPLNRMRNPWIYMKLMKDKGTNQRAEIHDIMMEYFI